MSIIPVDAAPVGENVDNEKKTDSEKRGQEKKSQEKKGPEEKGPEGKGPEETGQEETDSEDTDLEETDPEEADMEETDIEGTDVEDVDSMEDMEEGGEREEGWDTEEDREEVEENASDESEDADKQTLLDKCLFVWHCAGLVLCLLLLVIGVILRYNFTNIVMDDIEDLESYAKYSHFVRLESAPEDLIFGDLVPILGNSLITLNASYSLCILIYMSVLINRNPFTLPFVILLTGTLILIKINIINIYMSPVSAANEDSTATLKEKLAHLYSIDDSTTFSVTYDIISIWGSCCGIVDQYDFQNMELKYIQKSSERKTLQVPPTCCTRAVFEKTPAEVLECATKAENIYPEGCYVVLYNWLRKYCNIYSLVIVAKLIDMCVHIVLYKRRVYQFKVTHRLRMIQKSARPNLASDYIIVLQVKRKKK